MLRCMRPGSSSRPPPPWVAPNRTVRWHVTRPSLPAILLAFALASRACAQDTKEPSSPRDFVGRGCIRLDNGDLEGAVEDFSKSIRLDPNYAPGYYHRGLARDRSEDFEGAIADFTEALRLHPRDADCAVCRGYSRAALGDLDGAIKDYDRALQLDPSSVPALVNRGIARAATGDTATARADLGTAVRLAPERSSTYFTRANLLYAWGEFTDALTDVRKCLALPDDGSHDYASILGMLCRLRDGEEPIATRELSIPFDGRDGRTPGDWPASIALFLQGGITEEELLTLAGSRDGRESRKRNCEAWFYIGSRRLSQRNATEAKKAFQQCVASKVLDFWEHKHAVAELDRLERCPAETK